MAGQYKTQINPRTGQLRLTITELTEAGVNTITVVMPPQQALDFAQTITQAIQHWEQQR